MINDTENHFMCLLTTHNFFMEMCTKILDHLKNWVVCPILSWNISFIFWIY